MNRVIRTYRLIKIHKKNIRRTKKKRFYYLFTRKVQRLMEYECVLYNSGENECKTYKIGKK